MKNNFPDRGSEYSILKITKNSIGLNNFSNNLRIYPNPSKGIITIGDLIELGSLNIEITDIKGKIVFQSSIKNFQSSIEIDLSEITKGVYLFSINNKDFKKIKKIVIQ